MAGRPMDDTDTGCRPDSPLSGGSSGASSTTEEVKKEEEEAVGLPSPPLERATSASRPRSQFAVTIPVLWKCRQSGRLRVYNGLHWLKIGFPQSLYRKPT